MSESKLELLDAVEHADIKVDTINYNQEHYAKNASRLVVSELKKLIHEYPIFVVKSPETGEFQLTALLGFNSGENLFIQDGKWRAKYLPLDMLRHPFQLYVEEGGDQQSGRLVIDTGVKQVSRKKGEALFDKDGNATNYLVRIRQTFSALLQGKDPTQKVLEKMLEHNLLESVTLTLEVKKQEQTVNGLYTINIATMNALSGNALEECHKSGVLETCHLIMSSATHLEKMIEWANQ